MFCCACPRTFRPSCLPATTLPASRHAIRKRQQNNKKHKTQHNAIKPQVIFGRGNASIGLHFDKDNACAGGSRVPVATYLAICRGAKLVLLLPPQQTLLPPGGDSRLLLAPTPQLLADVRAAGGHFFILEDAPTAAAAAAASASSGGGSSTNSSSSGSSGSSSGSGVFDATALVMPPGWWHWVVGLTDWHVVYGGSLYPEAVPR